MAIEVCYIIEDYTVTGTLRRNEDYHITSLERLQWGIALPGMESDLNGPCNTISRSVT